MSNTTTPIINFRRRIWVICASLLFLAGTGFLADSANAQDRVISASSMAVARGVQSQVEIQIRLDSQGNESSVSFSINFNPFVMTSPTVTLGIGAPLGSTLETNTNNLTQGQLGILVNSPYPIAAGTRNIVTVTFTIPANAAPGANPVLFGSNPTPQSVSQSTGELLSTTYAPGVVTIGTADGVGISGRVLTPDGRAMANVLVIATDENGNRRLARTSSFGLYTFPYVTLGRTYTLSVNSKRYRFTPRVIQPSGLPTDLDFVGQQ